MSNETQTETEDPGKGGGGKLLPALVVLVGLGAGGMTGSSMLGPSLGPAMAARAAAAPSKGGGGHGGGHGEEAASALHVINNLVVNPARSAGTRFLLASIAIEPNDPSMTSSIAVRDVELRDALLSVLGRKPVEVLTDVESRPALVEEIRAAVEKVLGHDVVHRIYLPQFVIQ